MLKISLAGNSVVLKSKDGEIAFLFNTKEQAESVYTLLLRVDIFYKDSITAAIGRLLDELEISAFDDEEVANEDV